MFRKHIAVSLLVLLLSADALVLTSSDIDLHSVAAVLAFCFVPGCAIVNLIFPPSRWRDLMPEALLGVAISYVMSNLTLIGLSLLPGRLSLGLLLLGLNLLSLVPIGLIWVVKPPATPSPAFLGEKDHITWLWIIVLLALLLFFRFVGLGYSQFNRADEIPILTQVTQAVSGDEAGLLNRFKPPAETFTALGFVLFTNSYQEFALRLPFALASILSVLMLYMLGRVMFSERAGFVAGLLLALEGWFLGLSRFAQYQGIVMLMAIAALYVLWLAASQSPGRTRSILMLLGVLFLAFGCLTHFDMLMILPLSVIPYMWHSCCSRWERRSCTWSARSQVA